MKVESVHPADEARWADLADRHGAGVFQSGPWMRALQDAYGFRIRGLVATDGAGRDVGGIAYVHVSDTAGPRLVSLPFSDACDPPLDSVEAWEALFECLRAVGIPLHLRVVADRIASADARLLLTKQARWHSFSVQDAWSRFDESARRGVRKAQQVGVVVRALRGADELAEFVRLHVSLRKRKYRLLAQPPVFFESLARRFGESESWFPMGAFVGDRLVAGTIYLKWGDTLYYKFNASAPEALGCRPNNLLVWEGVRLASSQGCTTVDLGPSDDDQPGLIRFKANHGGQPSEVRFLRYTPPGWCDERANDTRELLGTVTGLLTGPDVPDDLTGRAGSLLYSLFA